MTDKSFRSLAADAIRSARSTLDLDVDQPSAARRAAKTSSLSFEIDPETEKAIEAERTKIRDAFKLP